MIVGLMVRQMVVTPYDETDNGDTGRGCQLWCWCRGRNAGVTLGDDYVTAVLVREIDSDDDGTPDTLDAFPFNSAEQADADKM